jgi:hypothetical protein
MSEPKLNYLPCPDAGTGHRMAYWEWGDAQAPHVVVCVHDTRRAVTLTRWPKRSWTVQIIRCASFALTWSVAATVIGLLTQWPTRCQPTRPTC